jgi:deoxycytidylate deaminase
MVDVTSARPVYPLHGRATRCHSSANTVPLMRPIVPLMRREEPSPNKESKSGTVALDRYYPELVISLCAAAGTDTVPVYDALASELRSVGYKPILVRLSVLMGELPGLEYLRDLQEEDKRISESQRAGNAIRRILQHGDAVVRLALSKIHSTRASLNESQDPTVPAERHCFIISSLKRHEELETLRQLFGQRALLISIYEPKDQRVENLCRKIAGSRKSGDPDAHCDIARELIDIDQNERSDPFGQRLEDVFPKADVFLKAGTTLREDARRFVQLLFGAPYLTPTIDEFLMFQARATAQRSADLSRQVGAVIATKTGEILATGCNEVPRAGGGVNWDSVAGSDRDYRDYRLGQDAAAAAKMELVTELLKALSKAKWLCDEKLMVNSEALAQEALFGNDKPLAGTAVANLLEFGRIVHAEMAAICDAAMRGVPLSGGTLYCTTFPCHMCARHIMAAGIQRVVYIEPYPKSRAKRLYKRAIQVDEDRDADTGAVRFEAFVGVAPSRFIDIFDMVERKDRQGYSLNPAASSNACPKAVKLGALVTDLESSYFASVDETDWSQLANFQKGSDGREA